MAQEEQRYERSRGTRAVMIREQSGSSEALLLGTLGGISAAVIADSRKWLLTTENCWNQENAETSWLPSALMET
jgi:hypothetical protein